MTVFDQTPDDPPLFFPNQSDPWDGWKPEWRGKGAKGSPHAQQEKQAPTEAVRLRSGHVGGEDLRCRRRITDARLWDAMSTAQQDAALQIARASMTMGRGLGYAASQWEKIPGERGSHADVGEAQASLIVFYVDWAKACHKAGVSHAMIVDILVQGLSCAAVDRARRIRKGSARANLMDGLTLYCEMKGWKY